MVRARHLLVLGALVAGASASSRARAQDSAATVQALFDDGRRLVAQGRVAEACPKFLASYHLERRVGTLLNLADCYERTGLTASAWARFVEAAPLARRAGQSERAEFARAHAASLEPKLSRLTLQAPPSHVGLEIRRNGVVVVPSVYGVAIPVDPGPQRITASAPGKRAWSTEIVVGRDGDAQTVAVPELEPVQEVAAKPTLRMQATAGVIAVGAGAVLLGVGAFLGVRALEGKSASEPYCVGNDCEASGVALRQTAIGHGNLSTAFFVTGALVAAGGFVLWFTAPPSGPRVAVTAGDRALVVRGAF